MLAWFSIVMKLPCKCYSKVYDDDEKVAIDNKGEPVKGHGLTSSPSSRQQDGKNGGCDGVGRGKKRHSKRSITCLNKESKTPVHPEFEIFWLENDPFSQWYRREFIVGEQKFSTAEQYMMYQKAKLFNDDETAKKILAEVNPRKQKKLGRQVKNFSDELWKRNCIKIVKDGNKHKFLQNKDLLQLLISTYPKTLVEASPYDKYWGIGMAASDPRAQTVGTWDGYNYLGYALTEVRNELMQKNDALTYSDKNTLMMTNFGEEVESTYL